MTTSFHYFSPWAEGLEDAGTHLLRLPKAALASRLSNPQDPELLRMARLDCDWHGENARCFSTMPGVTEAFVFGASGLNHLLAKNVADGEVPWLIFDGQNPQKLVSVLPKLLPLLKRKGWRVAFYAFDEASRTMPVFPVLAPHLSVLIHDEAPLDPRFARLLPRTCVIRHHSWVANIVPFAPNFVEKPEERIVFLGSKLGLTPHRQRQLDHLQKHFGDRLVIYSDHSVDVGDRYQLSHYKVSLCPEGRKFTTPAMSATHTDRPFWSGCLGMVPVSENSLAGNRLDALHVRGLIQRYRHGDLKDLTRACEKALAASVETRRTIYQYFNEHETVGTVLGDAMKPWLTPSSSDIPIAAEA